MNNSHFSLDRRAFLAMAGTASIGSLAGCSVSFSGGDGEGGEDGGDGEAEPTATPTDTEDAGELIQSASSKLETARSEFTTQTEQLDLDGTKPSLDMAQFEETLDAAAADVTAARNADPTDDQRAEIEALQNTIDFYRALENVAVEMKSVATAFYEADSYFENEQFEQAVESLRTGENGIDSARQELSVARSRYDAIEARRLDDFEFDQADLETSLDKLETVLQALEPLVTSLRQMAQGMPPYQVAVDAFDSEDWSTAADKFREAADHFTAAHVTLEDAVETGPDEYRADFEEMTCNAEKLQDAAVNFSQAAEEFDQGDSVTAQEHASAGSAALDRKC